MKKIAILLTLTILLQAALCACGNMRTSPMHNNGNTGNSEAEQTLENSKPNVWILVSREHILTNGEKTTTTYNYDKNHNYLSTVILKADGTEVTSGSTYLYDDYNNLIEKKGIYSNAKGDSWCEIDSYTYDENGNCIEYLNTKDGVSQVYKRYYLSGTVLENTTYENGNPDHYSLYDENENLLKEEYYEDAILEYYIEYTYDENGNQTEKAFYTSQGEREGIWELYCYDEKGDMVKSEFYREFEKFSTSTYTYDENHNVLTHRYCYADGEEQWHYTFSYDRNGNKTEQTLTEKDGTVKWTWQYDEKGNLLAEKHYEEDGNMDSSKVYTYDNGGRVTEYLYISDGHWKGNVEVDVIEHYKYTYDEKGNELSYWYYSWLDDDLSDCDRNYSYEKSYDVNGNVSEYIQYNGNGDEEYRDQYSYDDDGNVLEHTHYNEIGVEYREKYTRDTNGNVTTYVRYDEKDEEEYHVVYTYDENGNLIELVRYSGGSEEYRNRYTYQNVCVGPEDAERILAQQESL